MWWMIPFSILTISAITCSLVAMNWMRRDFREQTLSLTKILERSQSNYDALTRTLLGVPPSSPEQITTMLSQPEQTTSNAPEEIFESLSPEIQGELLREWSEATQTTGNLSAMPARIHPDVVQKNLADPTLWPKATVSGTT